MLSIEQVKLLQKAISTLPGEPAAGAKWILAIVLEDEPPNMPPVVEQLKAIVSDEKTPDQKRIEELEAALVATRQAKEAVEVKLLEEVRKRNGGN